MERTHRDCDAVIQKQRKQLSVLHANLEKRRRVRDFPDMYSSSENGAASPVDAADAGSPRSTEVSPTLLDDTLASFGPVSFGPSSPRTRLKLQQYYALRAARRASAELIDVGAPRLPAATAAVATLWILTLCRPPAFFPLLGGGRATRVWAAQPALQGRKKPTRHHRRPHEHAGRRARDCPRGTACHLAQQQRDADSKPRRVCGVLPRASECLANAGPLLAERLVGSEGTLCGPQVEPGAVV